MLTRIFKASFSQWHHTTILAIKHKNQTVIIGDGQVTYGNMRLKTDGKKIRHLSGTAYCGFAGSLADALTLMEGLSNVITSHPGQTLKACIKYAQQWRTGKMLKHLQATLIVIDRNKIIELDGTGNVIQIQDIIGIGSGGQFAQCAARALMKHTDMSAEQIALQAMKIAAQKCIYTSDKFIMEKVPHQIIESKKQLLE